MSKLFCSLLLENAIDININNNKILAVFFILNSELNIFIQIDWQNRDTQL